MGPIFLFVTFLVCLHLGLSYRRRAGSISLTAITLILMIAAIAILTDPHAATAFNDVGIYPPEDRGFKSSSQKVHDNSAFATVINSFVLYLEGAAGALLMALSFIGAVFTAGMAVGRRSKRAALYALALFVISIGAFVGRSMMSTFKPVIYLYPEKIIDVGVKLRYKGDLTVTYPFFDALIEGWKVTAFPNGKLINSSDRKEYSYLFWEGVLPPKYYVMPSEGFVVPGNESATFLQDFLGKVGLTPAEYNEFIVYWYPQIKDYPYVQIALAGNEYDQSAPLEIIPKPESILRVFVYFKKLSKPLDIPPQRINRFVRKGFTVVEWGGTVMP